MREIRLHLRKMAPCRHHSAWWMIKERPGIVLALRCYNRDKAPLAPTDGWTFQGLWGEQHFEGREWLSHSPLKNQVFSTRREALQALQAALLG